ncbi:hypothetical protein BDB00DRAFT_835118 [Zychaea mexicana]|uniref:uncharacterized protein n=1 Tax=Zychaea mexicana TaxID=64656 RepID=UPI0022FE2F34|nr:uncharacterized protein BDB00DRAFT_835118 [Zychaea mexicana]KAI9491086.1 hypothetical protein BDB00DRAFT_835118 [Zychaea mexicana]
MHFALKLNSVLCLEILASVPIHCPAERFYLVLCAVGTCFSRVQDVIILGQPAKITCTIRQVSHGFELAVCYTMFCAEARETQISST